MREYINVLARGVVKDSDDGVVISFYGPQGGGRGSQELHPLDALKLRDALDHALDKLGTKFRDRMVIASTESDALTHSTEEK